MNGLLELMTRVKGIEYLLALGFLFSFVGFWQWHHNRGRGMITRVAPLALIAAVFGGLAALVIMSAPTATKAQEFPTVDQAHYLANIYGPAKFAAHGMSPDVISCQTCHHHSPDGQPKPCKDCHQDPFDGQATAGQATTQTASQVSDKPGLKAAYHQRCADCHTEAFSGPMTCTNCHTEKPDATEFHAKAPFPATAPDISHGLLDRYSNCFSCHNPEGPLPLPGNHKDYKANVECLGCHKPAVTEQGETIRTMQKPVAPAPAAPAPAPAAQPAAPAPAAEPAAPAAAPAAQPAAQPAPAPAAQPAAAPAAQPAPAAAPSAPKTLSHPVAGRENCTMCHQVGGAMKPMPADHSARSNSTCQACHKGA